MSDIYKDPEKIKIKEELKIMKESGEAPQFLTWFALDKLRKGYLLEGETPKGMYKRVSEAAAGYLPKGMKTKYKKKFFDIFWNNWLAGSTPVLGNMGTTRGMPVSCSASYTGDSLEEILYTQFESGMLSKHGFGTATLLDLRAGYSPISTGGTSNSIKDWVEQNWSIQNKVTQSNLRRGSMAQYIDFWHGDLFDVLPMLETHDRLHLGIICDDSVKEALARNDEEAMKRYTSILSWRAKKGKPYIIFIDNAKRQDPSYYKDKGLSTKHSNLCVTGDQRVVSSLGYLTAKELHELDCELLLFNGEVGVESSKMELREQSAKVYKMRLENGLEQKMTEYHGVPVLRDGKIVRTQCKDLKLGDRVPIQTKKGLFGVGSMEDEAFLLGLYQADGTQHKDIIMLDLWENDFDLLQGVQERFERIHYKYNCHTNNNSNKNVVNPAKFHDCTVKYSPVAKKRLSSKTLKRALNFEKGYVPSWMWESDEATVWQYIKGLLYADGTVHKSKSKGEPIQLSLASIDRGFLQEVQLLFNNLGLQSSIRLLREEGTSLLPDGKGGHKYYPTKNCYRLIVGNKNSCKIIEENTKFLSRKGITLATREFRDNTKKAYKVESISYVGEEAVYCPTIYNEEHIFISNGVKTFNCSEVFLHTDKDHTLSCVLSSMNCTTYDEWKDTDAVETAIIFLDCVAEDLIQRGKNIKGLERVVRHTEKGRALGLGLLGFHTYLQSKGLPLNSLLTRSINNGVFKNIKEKAEAATKKLAKKLGEPEWCAGTGRRNTHLLCIAPNTSSALIAGSVSQGIEPIVANVYTQKSAKGTIDRINPELIKVLRAKGKYNEATINSIAFSKGSVQHLGFLTDDEKEVFKTAYEVNQKLLIDLAEQRQKFICQGQSLNLFFNADESEERIHEVHKHAFEQELLKSLYYVRTMSGISADNDDECVSCHS